MKGDETMHYVRRSHRAALVLAAAAFACCMAVIADNSEAPKSAETAAEVIEATGLEFTSFKANASAKKCIKSVEKIDEDYLGKLKELKTERIKSLKAVLDEFFTVLESEKTEATKAGDLDGAIKLRDAAEKIKKLGSEADKLPEPESKVPPQPKPRPQPKGKKIVEHSLLSLVQPIQPAIRSGKWEWTKAGLQTEGKVGSTPAVVSIPYRPVGEYDLEVSYTASKNDTIGIGFMVGDKRTGIAFNSYGKHTGFYGRSEEDNIELQLPANRKHTISIQVRTDRVTILADGRRVLARRPDDIPEEKPAIQFGYMDLQTHVKGRVVFHSMKIREIE
jgi:hypothetical protein